MSEIRRDPISGRWVIVAAERGKRPSDFHVERQDAPKKSDAETCPFCPGHEALTPPELLAYRPNGGGPNSPGWELRVVPNKFPALTRDGGLEHHAKGLFEDMSAFGSHEVIIETPDHEKTLATMSDEEVSRALWACRERLLDLKKDDRIRYVIVFKNHGAQAGATREHSHSQLIALPIVPDFVREELDGAREHFAATNRCVFCEMLREEREGKARVIFENDNVVALAPYASRCPFEAWLVPKRHGARFEDAPRPVHDSMAAAVRALLGRMNRALDTPPYNLIVHTAPFGGEGADFYHWHIELMPRLSRTAGFEWGTGFYINPLPPEEAAERLRGAGG